MDKRKVEYGMDYSSGGLEKSGLTEDSLRQYLSRQLQRMAERVTSEKKERDDPKYLVLKKVVDSLFKGKRFFEIWESLNEKERHSLMTRLENMEYRIRTEEDSEKADRIYKELIVPLQKELYGTSIKDGEECVDFCKKKRLEQEVMKEYWNNKT